MCLALLAGACSGSYSIPGFHAYRIEIQQGNAITHEMVAKLKPGMTRAQVRFALGTPLIIDPFRKDRWDYVYYDEKPGQPRQYRHAAVFFKGERLERVESDIPAGAGSKEGLSTEKPAAVQASGSSEGSASAAKSGRAPQATARPQARVTSRPKPSRRKSAAFSAAFSIHWDSDPCAWVDG